MTIYSLGRPIENDIAEPVEKSAEEKNPVKKAIEDHYAYKHGYFSKFRSEWSEMDRTIVNGLSKGKYIREIASSLGLKERYLQNIVEALRRAKKVKNNIELIEIAFRDGVIK